MELARNLVAFPVYNSYLPPTEQLPLVLTKFIQESSSAPDFLLTTVNAAPTDNFRVSKCDWKVIAFFHAL